MRRYLTLLIPCLALLVGCPGKSGNDLPTTGFVMKPEEIPGESQILKAEDDRHPDVGQLRSLLRSTNALVRARAALSVGRQRQRVLTADLAPLLKDREESVRASAALAAGFLGDPELLAGLDELLTDPDLSVRSAAMHGRSLFGGDRVPDAISAMLTPNPEAPDAGQLLGEGCLAITQFQDLSVVPQVAALVNHADPEVRWRAVWALGRLKQSPDVLAGALADADPRVRSWAALGLGSARVKAATPALIAALDDPDTGVAAAAADALGAIDDDRSSAALARLASSPVPRRRLAAIDAIARSGQADATSRSLLNDPNPWIRARAVTALSNGGTGVDFFRRLTTDPEWRVRAAAAEALAARRDVTTLAKEMQYDPDARVIPAVLEGLAALDYKELDTILAKHLADKDAGVRATAARLLVRETKLTAVELLATAYEASKNDDGVEARLAIVEALARLPLQGAQLNTIKQAALDQDWVLKSRAYAILQEKDAVGGIAAPERVGTLRTESFYRDLVGRGDFDYRATFTTDKGEIVFRLYPKLSPLSVAFLEDVAGAGYYLNQPLTAMTPALEIGGGDDRGNGNGRFSGWVRDEPHGSRFSQPQVYMHRVVGRDSGCSQFRFTYLPRPDLDGSAYPFGELMSDPAVLDQLTPGEPIRSVAITSHEFRGHIVRERVRLERPTEEVPATTAGPTTAKPPTLPGPEAAPWIRPNAVLYLSILAAAVLIMSLLPALSKPSEQPPAMWVLVGIIVLICGGYVLMIYTGTYYGILTHETPGPRFLDKLNPPIMPDPEAHMVSLGVLGFAVFQLALLFLLTTGQVVGRWLFVFLALIEAAMFAAQLKLGLTLVYVISDVGIVLNVAKLWFLLMDKGIRQRFRSVRKPDDDLDDDDDDDVGDKDDFV